MTKWLTVLPVFSAIAIALVLYLDRPLFDSRLKTEKSWFGIHWLQPLQPVTKSLQCDDESSSNSSFSQGPPAGSVPAQSLADSYAPSAGGMCQLSGTIQDCCCDYVSVERANKQHLNPLLSRLVATPFFRYFKVNLWCDCSFWPDDSMCMLRDCSVCECAEEEVPQVWKAAEDSCKENPVEIESAVKRTVSPDMQQQLLNIPGWRGFNNPWMAEDDQDVDFSYINLVDNPERYTGYKGEHAHRVWNAIYSQQCFSDLNDTDTCQEQRIFYRLISGMHASVSAHIANEYLVDEEKEIWGQNLPEFIARLGNTAVKERIENMYFTYLFVLRAVIKAGPMLASIDYSTGCSDDDMLTKQLMQQVVGNDALKKSCPIPFDEGRLWKGADAAQLKLDLQKHFQNITLVMDCVGCEKCKLWGKLQILGIATSLKILFSTEDCSSPGSNSQLHLERNEVIALMNLLERLSKSIEVVRTMSLQIADEQHHPQGLGAVQEVVQHKLQDVL